MDAFLLGRLTLLISKSNIAENYYLFYFIYILRRVEGTTRESLIIF